MNHRTMTGSAEFVTIFGVSIYMAAGWVIKVGKGSVMDSVGPDPAPGLVLLTATWLSAMIRHN